MIQPGSGLFMATLIDVLVKVPGLVTNSGFFGAASLFVSPNAFAKSMQPFPRPFPVTLLQLLSIFLSRASTFALPERLDGRVAQITAAAPAVTGVA